MAAEYEPEYDFLEARLTNGSSKANFPRSIDHEVKNRTELPEDTRFSLETPTYTNFITDGLLSSSVNTDTGAIMHKLGNGFGVIAMPEKPPRLYENRVSIRAIYPDGSFDIVHPQSKIYIADNLYYSVYFPMQKVAPGQTVRIPLRLRDGSEIPIGSRIERDPHKSIEEAELKGLQVLLNEENGDLTITFPSDRLGPVSFYTSLTYPDGSRTAISYVFEISEAPLHKPVSSSLSS